VLGPLTYLGFRPVRAEDKNFVDITAEKLPEKQERIKP
jgi:hypothetical protein